MKKVLVVDARMIGPYGHGISKYVEGIAQSLHDGDPLTDTLLQSIGAKASSDVDFIFLIRADCPSASPVLKFKSVVMRASGYHPRSWTELPKTLKILRADLFFNPTFASYPYLPCKHVQTVHDLNHLHFGNIAQKLYYQALLKPSIRSAEWVFTVSETVKQELVKWSGVNPEKIKVFYNRFDQALMVSGVYTQDILQKYGLTSGSFFLCITNDKKHKNSEMLISAYRSFAQNKDPKNAVEKAWKNAFLENVKRVGLENSVVPLVLTLPEIASPEDFGIKRIGNVGDQTMAVLLQNCAGFYFPSRYEGFGRPPVEAALNGVHFIAVSDIPVHHEAESIATSKFRFIGV